MSSNENKIIQNSSFYERIHIATNKQDTQQRLGVYMLFIFELYRLLMGTLLILFVPQNCGDNLCTMDDTIYTNDPYLLANLSISCTTLACFLVLYGLEIHRESKMIEYLEVNESFPSDNDSVALILDKIPEEHTKELWRLDKYYQKSGYAAIVFFLVNSIYSGFNIYNRYNDDKTATVFLTNILFLATKLNQVFSVVNTEQNIFFSSYLTKKLQYNYVDPDHMITHEKSIELTNNNDITLNEDEANVA